jgi:hypothetical protein
LSSSQHSSDGFPDPYQIPDPIYIWNNTGTGATADRVWSTDDSDFSCNTGFTTTDFFQLGRDILVDSAKPGWSPYTYPHPLRQGR